jgi:polar amino acid transport system substrate-binding protein
MKALFNMFYKFIMSLVLLFITYPSSLSANTITLVADEWCPYNCVPKSEKPGYVVEIAREIFKKSGHKVVYKILPWERALSSTMEGINDGVLVATPFSMPKGIFQKNHFGFYSMNYYVKKKNKWNYTSLKSLENKEIGAISGYSYGEPFDKWSRSHSSNIQFLFGTFNPTLRNFNKLLIERIDVFIEDHNVANYIMNKHQITNKFRSAGVNGEAQPVYIGFSPSNEYSKVYTKLLSDGIIKMRKSGDLKKILDKYNLSDWEN